MGAVGGVEAELVAAALSFALFVVFVGEQPASEEAFVGEFAGVWVERGWRWRRLSW